jgi:hypothetical protein
LKRVPDELCLCRQTTRASCITCLQRPARFEALEVAHPMESVAQFLGMLSGILMPFFNIPLILRIVKRRSSEDISLTWVVGVWACVVGMVPASLISSDLVLFTFGIVNVIFFSGVLITVLYFHPGVRKRRDV